jgi:hypothetical protein
VGSEVEGVHGGVADPLAFGVVGVDEVGLDLPAGGGCGGELAPVQWTGSFVGWIRLWW